PDEEHAGLDRRLRRRHSGAQDLDDDQQSGREDRRALRRTAPRGRLRLSSAPGRLLRRRCPLGLGLAVLGRRPPSVLLRPHVLAPLLLLRRHGRSSLPPSPAPYHSSDSSASRTRASSSRPDRSAAESRSSSSFARSRLG